MLFIESCFGVGFMVEMDFVVIVGFVYVGDMYWYIFYVEVKNGLVIVRVIVVFVLSY